MPTVIPLASHWDLEPGIAYLNHGSFGACPRPVLAEQARLRTRMERDPMAFFGRDLFGLLDEARERLAGFLGTDAEGLVRVANATTGVNVVLRSLALGAGDEMVITDHGYNACRNAVEAVAAESGARVVVVHLPWPLAHPGEVVERVLAACGPRTRLALLDHVTSPTGMVLPIRTLVAELDNRGIDTLVDGAHAPGMLPLALDRLGAAFYTGNCHKWLCAPKGAAFLWARADRRERLRPLVVSHGANRRRPGRSRLHDEFDWQGTEDVSAFLCVPVALDFLDGLLAGGLGALMRDNRERALTLRARLADVLGVEAPCPDEMIGALVALPLPDGPPGLGPFETDPLQQRLLEAHRIEIPVSPFPASPRRVLRASVQIYNTEDDFGRLAAALASEGLGAG